MDMMWRDGAFVLYVTLGGKNKLFEVLSIVLFCCLRGKHYYIAINISDCFSWEKTQRLYVFLTHISTTLSDHVTSMGPSIVLLLLFSVGGSPWPLKLICIFFSTGVLMASILFFPPFCVSPFRLCPPFSPYLPASSPSFRLLIHSLFLLRCFSPPPLPL